jgi:hypothetical protein
MSDFNVRSDSVNVEQIMEQIRARIREKRGVDYTEEQIRQLATVKLGKFLDPRGVRSDLLEQFRKTPPPPLPNYSFEDHTIFDSTRGSLRFIRRLLQPILKLFFNPNPIIRALNIQAKLNTIYAERAQSIDSLQYEVLHNLVIEMTRVGIEAKNLKMQVESLTSRLEFNERRARALESVVVYKPGDEKESDRRESREPREVREPRESREPREPREPRDQRDRRPEAAAAPPAAPAAAGSPQGGGAPEGPGQRSRRRRRRRGRRGGGSAAAIMTGGAEGHATAPHDTDAHPDQGGDDEFDASDVSPAEAASPDADRPSEGGAHEEPADQRAARPEPIEQAFGATAHPAERTASDPAPASDAPAAPRRDTSDDPQ